MKARRRSDPSILVGSDFLVWFSPAGDGDPRSLESRNYFGEEAAMSSWKKGFGLILLLFIALAGTGCALFVAAGVGAAAGVGTAQYIGGELKQAYAAPMEKAWKASLAAVDELKLTATEKSIDNLDQNRVIKGKTRGGRDFQISLEATAKDVTTVKVRIGVFGDEEYSKEVQEAISKNLKKS